MNVTVNQPAVLDLSLANASVYEGCVIESVAGRLNLVTVPAAAISIIGRNVANILKSFTAEQRRSSIILTGPAPIWAYLIAFHAVVHTFREVWYDDGRNGPVLISRHG